MKKFIKYMGVGLVVACGLLTSCGSKTADGEIKVNSKDLEQAHNAGREAARVFVSKEWKDTFQLQQMLMEANSNGSQFDSIPRLRAAYDSAFISTIRTVRPQVAAALEQYQKKAASK